jgi:cytochrome P450
MAMVLLSAGRKTTAYALSWCLAMLVQYPEIQRRIRDELRTQLPELVAGEMDVPTKEQAARLVYLEAVVKETLRLNTVVPINTRDAIDDVVLSDGTFLPKGAQVLLSCYGMSRLPSTWGPDATEFKPERWLDPSTGTLRATSQVELIAFSAGRRVCPAKHFSILQMKVVLASLVSKFEITADTDPREWGHDATVALAIAGPQWIRPRLVRPMDG